MALVRTEVLAYIERRARLDLPFPSAQQISTRFGLKFSAPAQNALRRLALEGYLVSERIPDGRTHGYRYIYRLVAQKETAG